MRDYATDIILVMNPEYLTEIHATLAALRPTAKWRTCHPS